MAKFPLRPRGYLVLHLGTPVGRAGLTTIGSLGIGELAPEPGYAALRDVIRAGSRSLWAVGFLAIADKEPSLRRVPSDVVSRVAELPLELEDERGTFVPTDFVNIVEREDASLAPAVFVRFRLERAGQPAVSPPAAVTDSGRT